MNVSTIYPWPDWLEAVFRACRNRFPNASLASDSRRIQPGDLFLAFRHDGRNGWDYVADAIQRGAAAVIADRDRAGSTEGEMGAEGTPADAPEILAGHAGEKSLLWRIPGFQNWAGEWAHRWYDAPSEHLSVWGVTGTNGKTTVSQWLAQTLERLGHATGVVGTLGAGRLGALDATGFTTPSAVLLHTLFARFRDAGCRVASLEVSSIGVCEGRIDGVRFHGAIFTNLSRDHLDYHGSLAAYAEAKRRFLFRPELAHQIFWVDDPYGAQWGSAAAQEAERTGDIRQRTVWWVGTETTIRHLQRSGAAAHGSGVATVALTAKPQWIDGRWTVPVTIRLPETGHFVGRTQPLQAGTLEVPAAGAFQIANGALVLAALLAEGIALPDALAALAHVVSPPGRMEVVADRPMVVVDYAHTPDALAQALESLRPIAAARGGALWVVFGAGGNRDAGKRPEMGRAAAACADRLVVTSDNPRWESPDAIAAAILRGVPAGTDVTVQLDRGEAIRYAVVSAAADDVILLAGKGHEGYQEIAGEKIPFSDHECARAALMARDAKTPCAASFSLQDQR
ncbi:Mur ligase family protein [Hydrogenophilus thermoluteolus]|uniref:UDP-N-acetylmuramoyl-L-alanyl-D-glutamate--2,6-diaminopimelate ligase n=1 Tax=Hydrogenophilus thermoluteolus TaxID=297 RepID=A0A2Z6DX28_HYDTE|nr:UDP-N-acetylmuramoyl-L-alanyl-D-glutamate--2,6-diaminopimelate ligase [Hydrogenophilus thermoluteolus]BBD77034.1 UDP-N-acetylmuramyl-tripeptide synthetase [Hydrogenophilus thermoluteolus]